MPRGPGVRPVAVCYRSTRRCMFSRRRRSSPLPLSEGGSRASQDDVRNALRRLAMMSAKTIALIFGAVALSATGQVLLKSGAHQIAGLSRLEFLLAAARNTRVLSGLVAWLAWTVCWLYALRV